MPGILCFLCGERGEDESVSRKSTAKEPVIPHVEVMNAWKERCVVSTCRILRIPGSHPGAEVLLKAEKYCGECVQVMRDVEFSVGAMDKLQRQIRSLRQTLLTKLNAHWELLQRSPGKKTSARQRKIPEFAVVFEKVLDELASWTDVDFLNEEEDSQVAAEEQVSITSFNEILEGIKEEPYDEDFETCFSEEINMDCVEQEIYEPGRLGTKLLGESESSSIKESPVNSPVGDSDPDWTPNGEDEVEYVSEVSSMHIQETAGGLESNKSGQDVEITEKLEIKEHKTNKIGRRRKAAYVGKARKSRYVQLLNQSRNKIICPHGCKQKFRSKVGLDVHIRRLHNKPCDKCDKTFVSLSKYQAHLERHLKAENKNNQRTCAFCRINLKPEEAEDHEGQHRSREFPFSCLICEDAKFLGVSCLSQHMNDVHYKNSLMVCPECKRTYKNKSYLKEHIRKVHKEAPSSHQCEECGKVFIKSYLLERHKKTTHSEFAKLFICEECGKSYNNISVFNHHIQGHSDENPFKCPVCGKGFKTKKTVNKHEKIHSGISFQCPDCPKSFSTSRYLQQHSRCHLPRELRKYYYKTKDKPAQEAPNQKTCPTEAAT